MVSALTGDPHQIFHCLVENLDDDHSVTVISSVFKEGVVVVDAGQKFGIDRQIVRTSFEPLKNRAI